MSSRRTPSESAPHSFNKDGHMLSRMPLLMDWVFERMSSISRMARLVKSSTGILSVSVNHKRKIFVFIMQNEW